MAGRTGAGKRPTNDSGPARTNPRRDAGIDETDLGDTELDAADIDQPDFDDSDFDDSDFDDSESDDSESDDSDIDGRDISGTRRSRAAAAKAAAAAERSALAAEEDLTLKPSQMRGTEPMYGYLVALLLIGVSFLNLTDTHGKGAPKGPQHIFGATVAPSHLAVIGLVASVALLGVMQTRSRIIMPLSAVAAAFLTTLPKVPDSLSVSHLLALVVPVIFAFLLTQRQRKSTLAQTRAGGPAKPTMTAADRRAEVASRRRSRRQAPVQTGPSANRRYTPPKTKRPRR